MVLSNVHSHTHTTCIRTSARTRANHDIIPPYIAHSSPNTYIAPRTPSFSPTHRCWFFVIINGRIRGRAKTAGYEGRWGEVGEGLRGADL